MDTENVYIGSFSRKICFIPTIVFGPEAEADLSKFCGPCKKDIWGDVSFKRVKVI